jgi:hypothetical protein
VLERGARTWENVPYPALEGVFVCTDVATLRQCRFGAPIKQFGLVVELTVKVIAEQEVDIKGGTIQMLARNTPPIIPCDMCGEPTTSFCSQCTYEDEGVCVMHAQRAMHGVKRCYCR